MGTINGNGAFDAFFSGTSSDGSTVFFRTDEPLLAGDTDTSREVYQRTGGVTTRVSKGTVNGNGVFDASFQGATSDGSRIWFSTAESLLPGDTDAAIDLYERSGGLTTTQLSIGAINGNGNIAVQFQDASDDGSRVFFETEEALVAADTDAEDDVYRWTGGATFLVSSGAINGNGAFGASLEGLSADGARAFFETSEQLVAADTDVNRDLYERSGGVTTRVSAGAINGNGNFNASFVGASDDGTKVFFISGEPLVAADSDASSDIYERSAAVTTRISVGPAGGNGAFDAHFQSVSPDGSTVYFQTSESLRASDTDAVQDVYERSGGNTSLVSVGNGAFTAVFEAATDDGSAVVFSTTEQVIAGDEDVASDLYGAYGPPDPVPTAASHSRYERLSAGAAGGNGPFSIATTDWSADGSRVFFLTEEPLVAGDTDAEYDVYRRFRARPPGSRRARSTAMARSARAWPASPTMARRSGSSRPSRSSRVTRTPRLTCTSGPATPRPRSRSASSTGMARPGRPLPAHRATARRSSSGPASSWSPATPTVSTTSTSGGVA